MSNQGSSALHICIMAKEDIMQNKDSKFAAGMQVTCPYLFCNFKNSQFQSAGRFPSGLNDFLNWIDKSLGTAYSSGTNKHVHSPIYSQKKSRPHAFFHLIRFEFSPIKGEQNIQPTRRVYSRQHCYSGH